MTLPPSEGARIGHFRVVRQIGAGGAGVVYLAEDLDIPGRRVALKLLRPEAARGDTGALRREAAVLAALEHPHILVVHEIGESDRGLFLATELMPGGSMARRVKGSPLSEPEALAAARQAASALAAAHARGVLHRDFKPGNLLIAADGRVKVSDFGLAVRGGAAEATEALATTGEDDATRTTTLPSGASDARILGTPFYIPPESLEGAVQDAQGDQFAFGVALHEMLAGRKPFDVARGLAAVFDPPAIDRAIAPDLARIVARCLARDPRERFEGMEAVVAALDAAVARRSPERRRSLRVAVGAASLVTILVAAWGGARLYAAREARRLNEDGRAAFERGDLEGARRAFAGAHRADPGQLPPCANLGALALGEKNPAWAVPILGECAEAFPESEVVLYNYGAALRLKGDLPESERVLAEAARRAEGRPLEPVVANERALVLTALGRPDDAIALLGPRRPVTAATVEQAYLLKSLGLAFRASGRDADAVAALRESLSGALPPGARGEALVALGASSEAMGDVSGALAAYAEALAREGDAEVSATARAGLARVQRGSANGPRASGLD